MGREDPAFRWILCVPCVLFLQPHQPLLCLPLHQQGPVWKNRRSTWLFLGCIRHVSEQYLKSMFTNDACNVKMYIQRGHGHQQGQQGRHYQRGPEREESVDKNQIKRFLQSQFCYKYSKWAGRRLTDSPRSPDFPEPPTTPGAPGAPGGPGGPDAPAPPRSPYRKHISS